jgi:hypothetical protein
MMNPYEIDPETGEMHIVHVAWRALAAAELALERLSEMEKQNAEESRD